MSNRTFGDADHPWVLVAVMPQHKPRPIGQFVNRSDAEAMMRFLQRKVPSGAFYVLFDPGDEHLERSEIPANLHDALPIKLLP
jgi:hypothetical protein